MDSTFLEWNQTFGSDNAQHTNEDLEGPHGPDSQVFSFSRAGDSQIQTDDLSENSYEQSDDDYLIGSQSSFEDTDDDCESSGTSSMNSHYSPLPPGYSRFSPDIWRTPESDGFSDSGDLAMASPDLETDEELAWKHDVAPGSPDMDQHSLPPQTYSLTMIEPLDWQSPAASLHFGGHRDSVDTSLSFDASEASTRSELLIEPLIWPLDSPIPGHLGTPFPQSRNYETFDLDQDLVMDNFRGAGDLFENSQESCTSAPTSGLQISPSLDRSTVYLSQSDNQVRVDDMSVRTPMYDAFSPPQMDTAFHTPSVELSSETWRPNYDPFSPTPMETTYQTAAVELPLGSAHPNSVDLHHHEPIFTQQMFTSEDGDGLALGDPTVGADFSDIEDESMDEERGTDGDDESDEMDVDYESMEDFSEAVDQTSDVSDDDESLQSQSMRQMIPENLNMQPNMRHSRVLRGEARIHPNHGGYPRHEAMRSNVSAPSHAVPGTRFPSSLTGGVPTDAATQVAQLRRDIRTLTDMLFKRTQKEHQTTAPVPTASIQMIRRYEALGTASSGPSVQNFCIQMTEGRVLTKWNRRLIAVFVSCFMNQPRFLCRNSAEIKRRFERHLRYIRSQVLEGQAPISRHGLHSQQQRNNRLARRRRLMKRRKSAWAHQLRKYPELERFASVWSALRWEAMSGDESDHIREGKLLCTRITRLPWRSRAVDAWMRVWCCLYLSTRFNGRWSCKKGNFPHPRYPSREERLETGLSRPVPGLPLNFYDSMWLTREAQYDPDIKRTLRIQPAISLKLPGGLLRLARMFNHVATRKDHPLPRDHAVLRDIVDSVPFDIPLPNPLP